MTGKNYYSEILLSLRQVKNVRLGDTPFHTFLLVKSALLEALLLLCNDEKNGREEKRAERLKGLLTRYIRFVNSSENLNRIGIIRCILKSHFTSPLPIGSRLRSLTGKTFKSSYIPLSDTNIGTHDRSFWLEIRCLSHLFLINSEFIYH